MSHRKKWAGAAIAAFVALGMLGTTVPASADPGDEPTITITINGESVAGHSFKSVRIAKYDNVDIDEDTNEVTGFDLVTEGNPAFKTELIKEIVRIDLEGDGRIGGNYNASTTFVIQDLDPMHWVAKYWTATDDDDWDNEYANNANLRELANWLESNIALFNNGQNGWDLTPTTEKDTQAETIELNVNEGLHFVWDSTSPIGDIRDDDDPKAGTNPLAMIVGTKFFDDEGAVLDYAGKGTLGVINVKGELVTIDKDIVEACTAYTPAKDGRSCGDATPGGGDEVEDSWTATTGDKINFVIRTNVPNYPATYASPKFVITDGYSAGLLPELETVQVSFKDSEGPLVNDDNFTYYTVTPTTIVPEGVAGTFTIILEPEGIARLQGKEIEVTYSAKVLAGADGTEDYTHDTNTAKVTFTNLWSVDIDDDGVPDNPANPEDKTTETTTDEDEVDVYTFPLDVRKADLNDHAEFLQAEFLVMDANDKVVGMIKTDGAKEEGGVQHPGGGTAFIMNFTEKKDTGGSVIGYNIGASAVGLAGNAWYQVVEYKAPDGYTAANLDVAKFWVYIDATHTETGIVADPGDSSVKYFLADAKGNKPTDHGEYNTVYIHPTFSGNVNDNATNDMTVVVLNAKLNSDMPSTGGQILLIVGLAGVLGLGGLTFGAVGLRKRKMTAATVQAA